MTFKNLTDKKTDRNNIIFYIERVIENKKKYRIKKIQM